MERVPNHRISGDEILDAMALRGSQHSSALQASPETLKILPERIQCIHRDFYPERPPSELEEDISLPLKQKVQRYSSLPDAMPSLQTSAHFLTTKSIPQPPIFELHISKNTCNQMPLS